jgi:hypothetical protein
MNNAFDESEAREFVQRYSEIPRETEQRFRQTSHCGYGG